MGNGVRRRGQKLWAQGKPQRWPLVAIKQCKFIHNNSDTGELMREALFLFALRTCRHVVHLVGVMTADERPALVMEYCCRGSLDSFLRRQCLQGQPVSWRVKARMLNHVALGIHAVHELGVLHCDIACRNVLIGRNLTCKIWFELKCVCVCVCVCV